MSLRVRKIVYQVHTEEVDDDGNPTAEGVVTTSERPAEFTLYAHQLAELPDRVADIIEKSQAG